MKFISCFKSTRKIKTNVLGCSDEQPLGRSPPSMNQTGSFSVIETNLQKKTFTVEFDIVEVPEDGYLGFAGY